MHGRDRPAARLREKQRDTIRREYRHGRTGCIGHQRIGFHIRVERRDTDHARTVDLAGVEQISRDLRLRTSRSEPVLDSERTE
jgi:hypothetical protein